MLLIAAGKDGWFNKWGLSNRVLVWFGLISYPLYLWHWPLLSIARIILLEEPPFWWRLAAFPVGIVLAWLTTRLIENPLRFGRHGVMKTVSLFVAMLALGAVGLYIHQKDGFPSRFPEAVSRLVSVERLNFDSNKAYGYECSSKASDKPDFSACKLTVTDPSKPTVALWGDSHATAIAYGLVTYFHDRYNFVLRQTNACPPVFDSAVQAKCKNNNYFVFDEFVRLKPQKVILSGYWATPDYRDIYKKLELTVSKLRDAGIGDIVVVGPLPSWKDKLPLLLVSEYTRSGHLPKRMAPADYGRLQAIDADLASLCKQWNVSYVSPARLLCDKGQCITLAGDAPDDVMTFDSNHLTSSGSLFLGSLFRDDPAFRIKPSGSPGTQR